MIVFTLFRQSRKIQINGAYEKRALDHDRIHAFVEQHYDSIIHGETYSNYLWEGYYYHITSRKEATPFIAFTLTVKEGAPFPEKDLRWLDVYERLNYRRALIENEALQASHFNNSLFDSVQFAILALNREGHILRQNSVARDYFHQESRQKFAIEDKEQNLSFQRMFSLAVSRNMAQQDSGFVYGNKDQFCIFSLNITPLPDSKDRISGAVVTAIDVTQQRMLQTEVEQLRRYGFLGEFSMGLAHDIKNPLMIIQGCTKQLPQEQLSLKNIISHQASRINDVITQFLSMGNFSDAAPALPLDLNQVLSDTVALVGKYHLNKHIRFHQELASPFPLFRAKELHIQQIFSNLLLNAIDAITTSGEIFLSTAVEAMKYGASDYIGKPFDAADLLVKADILLRTQRLKKSRQAQPPSELIGTSTHMEECRHIINKVKDSSVTVLITGESGTGKTLLAKEIHNQGKRAKKPFIHVDCASLPENLVEDELFGHEQGAFTGAVRARKGKFELAEDGDLFLDEIGTLSPALQTKLLNVLQERYFYHIGGTSPIHTSCRVLAATNEDLAAAVKERRFRGDLYFRLSVVELQCLPLRYRRNDIRPLAEQFFPFYWGKNRSGPFDKADEAVYQALISYDWPGNIRELENTIESIVVLSEGNHITISDLPKKLTDASVSHLHSVSREGSLSLKEQEIMHIIEVLEKNGGNRTAAAKELGISRRTLQYKLKALQS